VIVMIDMGIGNIQSVMNAFERVGHPVHVARGVADVQSAAAVVLPGVGAFGDAMAGLRAAGMVDAVRAHALERRQPLLGICVGMHVLADVGEEHGFHQGLGLIPGRVRRLCPGTARLRVPNMGWRGVTPVRGCPHAPLPLDAMYYFAHSYVVECDEPADVAATFNHGGPHAAIISRGPVVGLQFHPEKSQDAGLDLLHALASWMAAPASIQAPMQRSTEELQAA
jgi:imidazole glycerol-phosphate synthase subunit HisH